MFRRLSRENGLLEVGVRRRDHTKTRAAKTSAHSPLAVAKRNRQEIVEFHRILEHPNRKITSEMACVVGA